MQLRNVINISAEKKWCFPTMKKSTLMPSKLKSDSGVTFCFILKKFIGNMRNLVLNNLLKLQDKKFQHSSSIYCRISRKIRRKSRFKYLLYNLGKKRTKFTKNFAFFAWFKKLIISTAMKSLSSHFDHCQISSKLLAERNLLWWAGKFANDKKDSPELKVYNRESFKVNFEIQISDGEPP